MFKNEYQGGPFVDIFSAQGKDPTAKWKLFGSPSAIWKVFDKDVKSFVFVLEGSSQTNKMQLPKENKQTLGLIQRFLILQVHVPLGQDFSTELLITDLGNIKRRLYLSTVHKELSTTPLHAKIPLFIIKRKIWCNLCIDLVSFTCGVFKGAVFQSLDGIIVSANCKLRKIFTMKLKPQDTSEEDDIYGTSFTADEPTDVIPRNCQFTTDVLQVTQLLDMSKMRQSDTKRGHHNALAEQDQMTNRVPGSSRNCKNQDVTHIAFGSKVIGPPPSTGRNVRTSSETVRSTGIRSDRSMNQSNPDKKNEILANYDIPETSSSSEASDQISKENIHQTRTTVKLTVLNGSTDHLIIQPHPPQDASAERSSTRRLRVKSAGKDNNETGNDEWVFPEPHPLQSSKQPDTNERETFETLPGLLQEVEDEKGNPPCKLKPTQTDVFTFLSRPRSAPHGKSQNLSMDEYAFPLDVSHLVRHEEQRGARMEDDFYGSDSSEEEDHSDFVRWTSSPKSCLDSEKLFPTTAVVESHSDRTLKSPASPLSQEYSTRNYRAMVPSNGPTVDLKKIGAERVERSLKTTHGLSPTGSRPEFSQEPPSLSRTLKDVSASQLQTSLSRKSLKEIPRDDTRLTAETSDYDWRNYQPGRLSTSEIQMLASLKRQQNEELEDDGVTHGLSASQIDNCNVNISTSSDDTATWNSCLPPPVNQGRYYQKEMNPLSHSNPRDWLNVFSPPITAPSQQLAEHMDLSKLKQSHQSDSTGGQDDFSNEEDEEVLTLLYDSCLNCYFDPETGKYYELA
ncbi:protein CFAP20DC [Pleurodeles waltl]|uniref:protein CFAP20DC n=1 Tax=Pleurodeles waltl TaxID=8319 RepID=UPI0037094645